MDKRDTRVRSANIRVLQDGTARVRVGSRKLSKGKKSKTSVKSHKERKQDRVSKRSLKETDAMETGVLIVFWGGVIIVAEIAKWVAAFHFAKYLPWISKFMGGH